MPRKPIVVDLTQSSPATLPVARAIKLTAAYNGKNSTTRSTEDVEPTTKSLLSEAIEQANVTRLRSVLHRYLDRNDELAIEWLRKELLVPESAVRPWKEGDDDLGDEWDEDEDDEDEDDEDEEEDEEEQDDTSSDEDADDPAELEEGAKKYLEQAKSQQEKGTPLEARIAHLKAQTARLKAGSIPEGPASGKKRLRVRFATCENCGEEFDTSWNEKGDCIYHPDELELDDESDAWNDWDDYITRDTEEHRKAYPYGFMWMCCEKPGDEEGCKTGRHKEKQTASKKTKYQ